MLISGHTTPTGPANNPIFVEDEFAKYQRCLEARTSEADFASRVDLVRRDLSLRLTKPNEEPTKISDLKRINARLGQLVAEISATFARQAEERAQEAAQKRKELELLAKQAERDKDQLGMAAKETRTKSLEIQLKRFQPESTTAADLTKAIDELVRVYLLVPGTGYVPEQCRRMIETRANKIAPNLFLEKLMEELDKK